MTCRRLTLFLVCLVQFPLFSRCGAHARELHVDPVSGSDRKRGASEAEAWKSFVPLEKATLRAGDRVVLKPGEYRSSLVIRGEGSKEKPIRVAFAPGRYDFFPDSMQARKLHISNTNDAPGEPKKLAIVLDGVRHVVLEGRNSDLFCRGKMIEVFIEKSEHVRIRGLNFDYHRPTVSEMKVLSRAGDTAIVEIHNDSAYAIEDGRLTWVGEGWSMPLGVGFQKRDAQRGRTFRLGGVFDRGVTARQLEGRKVELKGRNKVVEGDVIQNREYRRDCVGVFHNLSRGITWEDCNLHFLHGMGVVSQFSEDITFRNVRIAPREGSGRTCAAWADMLHFSGCRGRVVVENVFFSGANDDAINVHGTYLAIGEKLSDKKVLVRFRHKQTYGFQPFHADDEVGFVRRESMTTYATSRVSGVERRDDREFVVTLADTVPGSMKVDDVLENRTWNPSLTVTGCTVEHIPTRGFLISTRGKVVVRNNRFVRTPMWSILIAGDCNSWFESGAVTDVLIEGNTFIHCRPISIHPENKEIDAGKPVHQNIRILNNTFTGGIPIVIAKSVRGLEVRGNVVEPGSKPKTLDQGQMIRQEGCSEVVCTANRIELAK